MLVQPLEAIVEVLAYLPEQSWSYNKWRLNAKPWGHWWNGWPACTIMFFSFVNVCFSFPDENVFFFWGTRVDPSVLVARRKTLPKKLLLLSAVWSQASATKTCVLLQTPVTHGWKHWLQWRQTLCVHPSPTRKMIQMSHWVHLPSCSVLSSLRALRHLLIFSPSMRPTYVPNSLMLWLCGKSWIRCCRNSAPRPK